MHLNLIERYCEAVTKAASAQGYKLHLIPIGFVWIDKDGNQFGSAYHTNDCKDALHNACMFLDQQKLNVGEIEIK